MRKCLRCGAVGHDFECPAGCGTRTVNVPELPTQAKRNPVEVPMAERPEPTEWR